MCLFGINQALKCVCFDTKTLNVCLGNKNGRMQWVKMDGNKGQALLRFFAKYYTSIMVCACISIFMLQIFQVVTAYFIIV